MVFKEYKQLLNVTGTYSASQCHTMKKDMVDWRESLELVEYVVLGECLQVCCNC